MTRDVRDPRSTISRRTLVQSLAVAAGATMAGAGGALAQGGPAAPPSTITNPPRDFSPRGAPTTYFWDPDIIAVDPSFGDSPSPTPRSSALNRRAVGGRTGLELAGALSLVERHSQ